MSLHAVLTKISPQSSNPPKKLIELETAVKKRVAEACPQVRWVSSYATLGPYDYLDVFEAPDEATAMKVTTIIRSFGHASTETWGVVPWDDFKASLAEID